MIGGRFQSLGRLSTCNRIVDNDDDLVDSFAIVCFHQVGASENPLLCYESEISQKINLTEKFLASI